MGSDPKRIEDMTAREIAEALGVTEDQAKALQSFIKQVGGVQNASDAVTQLGRLKAA